MEHERVPGEDDVAASDLEQLDYDYSETPFDESELEDVPDGSYQVIVDKVELTRAKSSGSPMLKWILKILGPQCANRLLWRHNVIASRENLRWLKRDLFICGVQLAKLSDLPANLERLLDVKLEVAKRTRGDSMNVYFNRRIKDGSETTRPLAAVTGAASSAKSDSEDIPF